MYFTPDGRWAIVVAEADRQLDFRNPSTMALHHALATPQCSGVDHMDYTANGRYALVSCEFAGRMIVVDLRSERIVKTIELARGAMPQDVKLSPDGHTFYVADMALNGVWLIAARTMRVEHFELTGAGAHGLYPSRNAKVLYVSNRLEGSITVLSFATGRPIAKWWLPGGGSPDMGGLSADGKVLWLSGRYNGVVYAISTSDRTPAARDQGRRRPARPLRVATAGALLDRTHGHPALAAAGPPPLPGTPPLPTRRTRRALRTHTCASPRARPTPRTGRRARALLAPARGRMDRRR